MPVDITFLRTDDIPVLCAEGAIDMGVTGGDLVAEAGAEVVERLGTGRRRMPAGGVRARESASVPIGARFERLSHRHQFSERHATVFSSSTGLRRIWSRSPARVEMMIALGVADAIVDLVETGSTLAANRLADSRRNWHVSDLLIQNSARGMPNWPIASCGGWKAW